MAKKSKEISVFTMSAVDLFCSALGAFMIIAIIVMPSYSKTEIQPSPEEIANTEKTLENLKEELKNLQGQNAQQDQENKEKQQMQLQLDEDLDDIDAQIQEAIEDLKGTFLIVVSSWETKDDNGNSDDIDMYISDPKFNSYNYKKKRHDGIDAEFAEDARKAVGVEIWETSSAMVGTYEVLFITCAKRIKQATTVKLRIYTKYGKIDLEDAIMGENDYSNTYFINIDEDGKANIEVKDIEIELTYGPPKPPIDP